MVDLGTAQKYVFIFNDLHCQLQKERLTIISKQIITIGDNKRINME